MRFEDVACVLDALDESGVRAWVGGGWGVAVLAGRQSREHRDLDLAVDADDLQRCLHTLGVLGYATETDQLPARIELRAAGDRWVDVHPVTFGRHGHGRQAGPGGAYFDYPAGAFARGALRGRWIGCLSIQQQRLFHTGYEHQAKDDHDLAELDAITEP